MTTCRNNHDVLAHLWERESFCNVNCLISELLSLAEAAGYPRDSEIDEEVARSLQVAPASLEDICNDNGIKAKEIPNGSFVYWKTDDLEPYGNQPPEDVKVKEVNGYWVKWDGSFEEEPFGPEAPRGVRIIERPEFWVAESPHYDNDYSSGEYLTKEDAVHGAWVHEEVMMYPTKEEAIEAAWDESCITEYDSEDEALEDAIDDERIDRYDYDHEVYEHYAVSGFMGRKLSEHGEQVVEVCNMNIWCRCCTGQSLLYDGIIQRIASSMEILEGQANSWVDANAKP